MSGSPLADTPAAGKTAPVSQPSNVEMRSFMEAPQMGLIDQMRMFQQQRGEQPQSSNPYQQLQNARYQDALRQPAVSMPGQLLQNYMKGQEYQPANPFARLLGRGV